MTVFTDLAAAKAAIAAGGKLVGVTYDRGAKGSSQNSQAAVAPKPVEWLVEAS